MKQIFTYWHSDELPLLNKLCINSWFLSNPEYKVHIITETNLRNYIPVFPKGYNKLIIQHKSDYIRMYVLYHYGGIWLDNTVILTDKIEKIFNMTTPELMQGFRSFSQEFIENSVLYSPRHNLFLGEWLKTYTKAIVYGIQNFYRINYVKYKEIYKTIYNYYGRSYLTNMICFYFTFTHNKHRNNNNDVMTSVYVIDRNIYDYGTLMNIVNGTYNFTEILKLPSHMRHQLLEYLKSNTIINHKRLLDYADLNLIHYEQNGLYPEKIDLFNCSYDANKNALVANKPYVTEMANTNANAPTILHQL